MVRNISLDFLKVILAIFVVIIHMRFLNDSHLLGTHLIVNGICRLGVPLFLIITGYYFFSIDNFEKLKQWCKRILLLYIFWMGFYTYDWIGMGNWIQNLWIVFFGYFHLWYLIGIFFSGIILYFFKNKNWFLPGILFLFCIGYGIQFHVFKGNIDKGWYSIYLFRNFLFFCLPFMGLGYCIAKWKNCYNYNPTIYTVISVLLLVLFESCFYYKYFNSILGLDLMISCLIACPIIFLYVEKISILKDTKNVAYFSTAIYLIHPFVLKYSSLLGIGSLSRILEKGSIFLAVFILSYLLLIINRKFKFLL